MSNVIAMPNKRYGDWVTPMRNEVMESVGQHIEYHRGPFDAILVSYDEEGRFLVSGVGVVDLKQVQELLGVVSESLDADRSTA